MKKSHILVLAMSFMGGAMLAGCSNGNASNTDKVELSINYYNGAISKKSMAKAKEKFPNYKLSFKQIPANDDFDTKLKASLNSKSAPDITAINSNISDYMPYADKFVNLRDYDTEKLADDFVEWKWNSCFTNDKKSQIAMPIDIGPTALFYNVSAFKKAGLPTDDKEVSALIKDDDSLMAAAKQLKDKTGMPFFQSSLGLLQAKSRTMTKYIYDENGKLTFGDGQLKEVWDYAVTAEEKGYALGAKGNSADGANAVQKGLFGGTVQASWGINDLGENGVKPEQWMIARTPLGASNYGGSYLAVIKTSSHPKEAADVVKYLTNEASQRANYEELALFPANKKVYDQAFKTTKNKLFGDEEFNHYFIEVANKLKYVPSDPRETAAFKCFEDQIILVAEQGKNSDKAWQDAVKKVKEMSKE
ncbi:ABC transporter substrate-binding protein [Lapidilactobacillus salsurivasis]